MQLGSTQQLAKRIYHVSINSLKPIYSACRQVSLTSNVGRREPSHLQINARSTSHRPSVALAAGSVNTHGGGLEASNSMRVITIPVLGSSKNYAYLLVDKAGRAAAVDPAEPETIVEAAKKEGVTIDTVLTTHKHWDHAGGNDKFKQLVPGVKVYGGVNDNCQGATQTVSDGDEFDYHDIHVKCIETPFHTMGHICYLCSAEGAEDLIFTGDTLFVAGCGRFFEGTPQNAYTSLIQKLRKVAPNTQVWCGHNYTASNLKFAQHVDPENEDVRKKVEWTAEKDRRGVPTVPSTIGDELKINPFLRVDAPAMQKFTGKSDPVEVMAALRSAKDNF